MERSLSWIPERSMKVIDSLFHIKPCPLCRVVDHLGSGQFGTVDRGAWRSPEGDVPVAVKTLNPGVKEEDRVKFLQEAAIMGQFSHPNVVKLYGVVTTEQPVSCVEVM